MRLAQGLVGLLLCVSLLPGQEAPHARQKVGLVLEGGGALGLAHIGVLEYFAQHHIPVDLIVGTSMGGLVAGLYAVGNSPADIRNFTNEINWDAALSGWTPFQDLTFRRKEDRLAFPNRLEFGLKKGFKLPDGLNSGLQVGLIFDRATLAYGKVDSFDELPTPFRCVATDLTSGKAKVFEAGSISVALRATMSIPGLFTPVTIDGHRFTDGGAVDNLPVDVAKKAGADIVIAVYLNAGNGAGKGYDSILSVAARNIEIMIAANEVPNMAAADILLNADLTGFTSADFKQGEQIIPRGYAAAEKKRKLLAGLALNDAEWSAYLAQRSAKTKRQVPTPQVIEVMSQDPNTVKAIQDDLAPYGGKPVDPPVLEKSLTLLAGDGVIDSVAYGIEKNQQGVPALQVRPYDKPYGPPFLDLGVTIDGANPENVYFGLAGRVTFQNIGGYRSEWRTDAFFGNIYGVRSEYYHPLTGESHFFVVPRAYATSTPIDLYAGQSRIAQYRLNQEGFGLDGGYQLTRRSEIRVGEDLFWLQSEKRILTDTIPDSSERELESTLRYRYYGTDNIVVPRDGFQLESNFSYFRRSQPNESFPQAQLRASYFRKVSKPGSLFVTADGGTTFGTNTLDLQLQAFTLGGPLRLGAYGENELLGNQYFLFQGGYLHELIHFSPIFGEGLYGTAFFEIGKIYDSISSPFLGSTVPLDGSVALIARTAIGPVFIGGSIGDNSHRKWWFGIGRVF